MNKLHIAILLVFCALFSSCMFEDRISASFDGSKESQGGPSAVVSTDDFAENFANSLFWGNLGTGAFHAKSDADDREWLPAGYEPEQAAGGRIMLGTTVEFVQKASKVLDGTQRLNYLVLIQDVEYDYQLTNGSTIFGGLGPYIGYGLGGSVGSGSSKIPAFSSSVYKRFDAGLHLTAGYMLPSSLHFRFGYELGLYDKSTDPSDYTSYNRTWSIAVGYSLNKIISGFKR